MLELCSMADPWPLHGRKLCSNSNTELISDGGRILLNAQTLYLCLQLAAIFRSSQAKHWQNDAANSSGEYVHSCLAPVSLHRPAPTDAVGDYGTVSSVVKPLFNNERSEAYFWITVPQMKEMENTSHFHFLRVNTVVFAERGAESCLLHLN